MDNVFIEKLNQLLRQVSLVDILRDKYKVIHRGGSQYTVQCPFHKDGQESNPSMSVDDDKGLYQCFTCGAKGNVITYLKEKEAMSFKDSVNYLGKRFSVDVSGFFSKTSSKKALIYSESKRINQLACNFFGKALLLKTSQGDYFYKEAAEYLKNRKIPFNIVKTFKIGYAPKSWDALIKSLSEHKIHVNNMAALGLIRMSKKNPGRFYDNFVNRIMFPIINERGEIIGFGGRSIDGSEPKYLNSRESLVFKKKSTLYGINVAKSHILKLDNVILVEGYMDTIACHKMGIQNVVGTLGTAITDEHAKEIKKYTNNVTLALDNDEAGLKATKLAIYTLLKFDIKLTILTIRETKDLDEYFTLYGKDRFDILYNNRLSWYDFLLQSGSNGKSFSDMFIEDKLKLANMFYRYFSVLKSETERQMLIGHISSKLSIDREAFSKDYLHSQNFKDNKRFVENKKPEHDSRDYENSLIYLLTLNPNLIKAAEKEISVELLKKDIVREFYIRLLTLGEDATIENALRVLGNDSVAIRIKSKENLYKDNVEDKLLELIVKIKTNHIDLKRREVIASKNHTDSAMKTDEGFEAICAKAREIHLLNKQKEKLHQGSDL